ncbi:hypothetical protein PoB_001581700, partial [Plakobranchus ocellatus]
SSSSSSSDSASYSSGCVSTIKAIEGRQRNSFSAKITDQRTPEVLDVQLLPGGRLVLADYNNECVKLFNTQGQHLHTLECRSGPLCLAVLDSSATSQTLAVTMPHCPGIDILEVGVNNMQVKRLLGSGRSQQPHSGCGVLAWLWHRPNRSRRTGSPSNL